MEEPLLVNGTEIIQRGRDVGRLLTSVDSGSAAQIEQAVQQFNEDGLRITILGKVSKNNP